MPTDNEVFYLCSCYGECINLSDWSSIYPDERSSMNDDLIISIFSKGVRKNNKRGIFRRIKLAFKYILGDTVYSDEIILSKKDALSMADWIFDRYYVPPIEDIMNDTLEVTVLPEGDE